MGRDLTVTPPRRIAAAALCLAMASGCGKPPEAGSEASRRLTPEEAEAIRRRSEASFRGEAPPSGAGREAPPGRPAGERPPWSRLAPDPRFPEQAFLAAFASARVEKDGLADAGRRADERARSELAKMIRVDVEARFTDYLRETREGSDAPPRQVSELAQRTISTVKMELEGVRIAERYHAEEEGQVYALAVLERALGAQLLDARLASLAGQIDAAYAAGSAALEAEGGEESFFQLSRARRLSAERAVLRAERMVVAPDIPFPPEPKADDVAIAAAWDRARRGLRFGVRGFGKVEGAGAPLQTDPVEAKVLAALRKRGIAVAAVPALEGLGYEALKTRPPSPPGGAPDIRHLFLFRVLSDLRPVALGGQKAHLCKSRLELVLLDLAEGRIVAGETLDLAEETKVFRPEPRDAVQESVGKLAGLAEPKIEAILDALFLYVGEGR